MEIETLPPAVDQIVARVFTVDTYILGDPKKNFVICYSGRLRVEDSAAAYDQLTGWLKPYDLTPLFRVEKEVQKVYLIRGLPKPKESNPWVNLVLFGLTIVSVLLTGATLAYRGPEVTTIGDLLRVSLANLSNGLPFALSMMAILSAHEFGHYFAGRYHGVHVSLPYFIPLPFSQFGTMGAFINLKEPVKNRRILLDIGIAGPLAGLAVAIPVLALGLWLSKVSPLPASVDAGTGLQLEGNSLLYLLIKRIVLGEWLPAPVSYQGLPPVIYWIRYLLTGTPLPLGGMDVMLHPVAWAGWAGILVTSLNLIPAGQLDGGHILYVVFGKDGARKILPLILMLMMLLGIFWNGWWLWGILILMLGRVYAEPLDQITPLDARRKRLAILTLAVFILVFTPVPLVLWG